MTTFAIATYQNEYIPLGGGDIHAVVTVAASGSALPAAPAPNTAIVVIVDVSGSMQGHRLDQARQAAKAAVDGLRDGALFAIVAGTGHGTCIFPRSPGLVRATDETRRAAMAAIDRLSADGGTAIGQWLLEARRCLAGVDGAIRHAILLTDGVDESETREELEAAVASCEGVFQCDCRGVGTNWRVEELRFIATRLLGSVDIVADPDDMPADFEAMVRHALAKRTADVSLRVWTPRGASIRFVKQVAPILDDLTDRAASVDERVVEVPTGAWGDESRDYHVNLGVVPQEVGTEMLAARVSLVVDGEVVAQALVRAVWTDDLAASTRIHPQVAHYTGQAELAGAIAEGLEARAAGCDDVAAARLGRAAQLAAATGHDATLRLLARVVDIVDADCGTVRLRRHVDAADEMALDTRSTRTVRNRTDPR